MAGVTPVTFTNTTSVEGTTVAEYFWHFGFSGEGNWSEEAEPDPIVYNQAGEYTVTLTAWGADGNRATVKKVVTVLADNVVPTADFSYSPMMVNGRRRGDLHRQVDRFRRRDRLARMGVPRRFDLDGDESLLHFHAEGHVPGQADRRRRPRR